MKRYDSYKDSGVDWIGEIPSQWVVSELRQLVYHTKEKNSDNQSTVLSLSYGDIVIRNIEFNYGLLPESFDSYQRIRPGYIVLRLTDLQNDKKSLRVGYSHYDGIITSVYVGLRVHQNIESRWVYYFLHFSDLKKVFYSLGGGIRQSLRFEELGRIPVCTPTKSEQSQIVQFLDEKTLLIDYLIEKTKRKIELLKEERTSLINHTVTKGLNPNVEMKDSGVEWIGEIPSHWELRKGSTIGNYSKGNGIKKDEVRETGLPCIRYGEIYTKYNHKFERVETFIEEGITDIKVPSGTLFMTGSGELLEEIGKCVVYVGQEELYVGGDIIILKPYSEFDSEFLSYQINSECIRIQRELNGRGGIIVHIYSKNFKDMWFPTPSLSEQEEIVQFLDEKTSTIDKTIELEGKRIDYLKEYRQSLISEVVTGKIKVITDE